MHNVGGIFPELNVRTLVLDSFVCRVWSENWKKKNSYCSSCKKRDKWANHSVFIPIIRWPIDHQESCQPQQSSIAWPSCVPMAIKSYMLPALVYSLCWHLIPAFHHCTTIQFPEVAVFWGTKEGDLILGKGTWCSWCSIAVCLELLPGNYPKTCQWSNRKRHHSFGKHILFQ